MTRVPVALSANSRFALPLAVTLHSLISTAGESTQLKIYLLGTDIHSCLVRAVERCAEVIQVPLPDADLRLPKRFSPEASAPVFLGRLLEEERILFLDNDLLILDDVMKLWSTSLQGRTMAAVQDLTLPWRESGSAYFNCGILLLDLEKFREERAEERALRHIRQNPTRFLHQTAFNALYRDSWTALDLR